MPIAIEDKNSNTADTVGLNGERDLFRQNSFQDVIALLYYFNVLSDNDANMYCKESSGACFSMNAPLIICLQLRLATSERCGIL